MKNILKTFGITVGLTILILVVSSVMMWGFNLSNLQMVYGLCGFLLIFLFSIIYLSNKKTKDEKTIINIVEDDIWAKTVRIEIEEGLGKTKNHKKK